MTVEIKSELFKFMNDLPAYGAIIATKLANPDLQFYNDAEAWAYSHGWFVILAYRLGVILYDIHKRFMQKELWEDEKNEVRLMTGYEKIWVEIKKLRKK